MSPALGWRLFQGLEHCLEACEDSWVATHIRSPRFESWLAGFHHHRWCDFKTVAQESGTKLAFKSLKSAMFLQNLAHHDNTGSRVVNGRVALPCTVARFVVGTVHGMHDVVRTLEIELCTRICIPSGLAAFSRDD